MRFRGMLCALLATTAVALAVPAAAQDEAWMKDSAWGTLRAGAVKSLDENAPGGNLGWGFGYRHMLTPRFSLGATVDYDLLGRFGAAQLIEIPASLELLAHFRWKTPLRPALGAGFAAVYRKAYRSGDDFSEVQPAGFLTVAMHSAVSPRTVLGAEFRAMSVSSDQTGSNPAFGEYKTSSGRTSFKISLSRTFR